MYNESSKRLDIVSAEQNATFRATINVYVPGSTTTPQNLTGCTAAVMSIAASYSATPIVTLTAANGEIVLGGTAGTVSLFLSAAQMSLFTVKNVAGAVPPTQNYYYDLLITYPSGDTQRVAYGLFTVYAGITALP